MEQKANIPSVQVAVRELAGHIQDVRNGARNSVTRQNETSMNCRPELMEWQSSSKQPEVV